MTIFKCPLLYYSLSAALFGDTLNLFRCRRVSNDTLKRHFKPFLSLESAIKSIRKALAKSHWSRMV